MHGKGGRSGRKATKSGSLVRFLAEATSDCPLELLAGAFAVVAPRPAAGPTLAFLKLLLGPANAAFSGHLLLGILDPADELVAGQRRDVLPGSERYRVGDQRFAQVFRKVVNHSTGHSLAAHETTLTGIIAARRPRRDEAPSGDGAMMAIIVSSGPRRCTASAGTSAIRVPSSLVRARVTP
jgi:hypothetical protein